MIINATPRTGNLIFKDCLWNQRLVRPPLAQTRPKVRTTPTVLSLNPSIRRALVLQTRQPLQIRLIKTRRRRRITTMRKMISHTTFRIVESVRKPYPRVVVVSVSPRTFGPRTTFGRPGSISYLGTPLGSELSSYNQVSIRSMTLFYHDVIIMSILLLLKYCCLNAVSDKRYAK
ncbi:hypothetical protein F4777DRAFT_566272 [Nemania sp. FL0916]|nr:hypothetical protein F4777DRAFT_566272 [Nemania sp. FL0916]